MLGYVIPPAGTGADGLLADLARDLRARGWPLSGAVQHNPEGARDGRCHMDLHVLSSTEVIRISQDLGALSRGCRLDPDGLERAVGMAEAALAAPARPRLVIVNKYGKQEIDGRGFRPLIGRALADGIPVLTAVGPASLAAFLDFAGGLAEAVAADPAALRVWAEGAAPRA